MLFNRSFILDSIPQAKIIYDNFPRYPIFSIDTRTIKENELFVALKGERFDGHDFLEEALNKNAAGLIVSKIGGVSKSKLRNKLVIIVPDTLKALIKLAFNWRKLFKYPVAGITGSVGKTSTKEILSSILKSAGVNFLSSWGNQNTLIGAALNIFRMRKDYKLAVFELGINKRGEMEELADLVRPSTALITNIGHSHLAGLGTLKDIANEKKKIFKFFKEDDIGIINGDMSFLSESGYNHPIIRFGFKTLNQVQARKINVTDKELVCFLKIYNKKYKVSLKNNNLGMLSNILAASTMALCLGIDDDVIIKSIQEPVFIPGRFEKKMLKNRKGVIIDDCYNANPESMKLALTEFEKMRNGSARKIAVIGDMLELGAFERYWHKKLARILSRMSSLTDLVLVGKMMKHILSEFSLNFNVFYADNWMEAVLLLEAILLKSEALILVKGSNGIGLKNLITHFAMDYNECA